MWVGLSKYVDMNKIKSESQGNYLFYLKAGLERLETRTGSVFYHLLREGADHIPEKIQEPLKTVQHFQLGLNNKEWTEVGLHRPCSSSLNKTEFRSDISLTLRVHTQIKWCLQYYEVRRTVPVHESRLNIHLLEKNAWQPCSSDFSPSHLQNLQRYTLLPFYSKEMFFSWRRLTTYQEMLFIWYKPGQDECKSLLCLNS